MGADHQDPVVVEPQLAVVELGLGPKVVREALPFHPSEEPPLGLGQVAGRAPLDGAGELRLEGDVVDRLGAVEGEGGVVVGAVGVVVGVGVAVQVEAGVDRRRGRHPVGMDVVAATAEVVVGVPGDVAGQDRHRGSGGGGRHDPREGEEEAPFGGSVEVVEAAALGCGHLLRMAGAGVAVAVPLNAGLRVVPVRRQLHVRPGAVLVVPADGAHELLLAAVAEEFQLVGLVAVNAELRALAAAHPLGPGIAKQPVGEEPEVAGAALDDADAHALAAVALAGEDHLAGPRRQIRVHGAGGAGPRLHHVSRGSGELQERVRQGHVALVAHVSDQHRLSRGSGRPAAAKPRERSRQLWQSPQGDSVST